MHPRLSSARTSVALLAEISVRGRIGTLRLSMWPRCPPPAPPSPSLRKPPSAGALTTLVFLYGRPCPPLDRPARTRGTCCYPARAPIKPAAKTRPRGKTPRAPRTPFSMPKPPPPRHRFKKFKIKRQNMKIELTFSKDSVIIKEKEAG